MKNCIQLVRYPVEISPVVPARYMPVAVRPNSSPHERRSSYLAQFPDRPLGQLFCTHCLSTDQISGTAKLDHPEHSSQPVVSNFLHKSCRPPAFTDLLNSVGPGPSRLDSTTDVNGDRQQRTFVSFCDFVFSRSSPQVFSRFPWQISPLCLRPITTLMNEASQDCVS